jgi:transposase
MYLRHSSIHKNGKTQTYWRLVRSVRKGRKVSQQHVAWLGELDAKGRVKARDMAQRITGRENPGQLDFFEAPPDESVEVKLKGVRLERSRVFGDVWLGTVLWNALKFDELFARLIPGGNEDVPWPRTIALLALARLCAPSSELRIAEQWFRKTALDDLLDIPEDKLNDDRLYRALDVLLPHKDALEQHVKNRLGEMFDLSYEILLYDVTSTYFEGQAQGNVLAQRGYSRDQRPDCKQVNIALVATKEGLPLSHEIFSGNTTDVKTVKEIVAKIEAKFGRSGRVWIMDRGMVSAEVLAWLRAEQRPYIVGTPKCDLKKFEAQVLEQRHWEQIREGLEVKQCPSPDGSETFILCRSQARKEKEQALHERFQKRIEAGLEKLVRRVRDAKRKLEAGVIERQIGRLLQRNARGAGAFRIGVTADAAQFSGLSVGWYRDEQWKEWHTHAEGCYLLRASQLSWTPAELWKAYIQLTDVEDAFRIQKTELEIRPVFHQSADRTRAHIFVCFIAYVLWKTLEQWSQRAGLGSSPRKLLEEFHAIQSTDVVLPTTDGRELRLRCATQPEKPLQILLQRLGLVIPQRLRLPAMLEATAFKV